MRDRSSVLRRRALSIVFAVCVLATSTRAGERFVQAQLATLKFESESPKLPLEELSWHMMMRPYSETGLLTYAVLDSEGEIYLAHSGTEPPAWSRKRLRPSAMVLRVNDDGPIRGRLFLAVEDKKSVVAYRFEVTTPDLEVDARARFFEAQAAHYDSLLQSGAPGSAWFRHMRDRARKELGTAVTGTEPASVQREPADLLDLFSGGRAIAENLDLDRTLNVAKAEDATIDVDSIVGVTTRALDWKGLIKDKQPELDPLARFVPADQHAVFFPSFQAMTRVLDDLDSTGTTLIEAFETRVEDQMTKERYEAQLCLPLSALGRVLGPTVVNSVAMTGSDPFLPSGSDVAILFDCKLPDTFETFLSMRRREAENAGAQRVTGRVGELAYEGTLSTDRSVSCYTARIDSVVVVTNSLPCLQRIDAMARDSSKSLLGADEYVWFRDRYKRGEDGESALIVLTDATIRRWAGPRSRIGDARRLVAAAAMKEITARNADAILAGRLEVGSKAADPDLLASQDFVWDEGGVRSPRFGTLRFLTPISEINVDKVSEAERAAYSVFRNTFQDRWRNYFDPIAVRLHFDANRMKADVTVMPLTIQTEYRELRQFVGDSQLPPNAGDPHATTLFHFASALSKSSELARIFGDIAGPTAQRFGVDPLGWLGESMSVYGERDPWWDSLRDAGGLFEAEDVDFYKTPIVLQFDVKDPLKLAGFLTALRAFADESAPNLVQWETRQWQGVSYVCLSPSESLGMAEPGREPRCFYVALPEMLIFTLREDLIRNAIDRRQARKDKQPVEGADRVWLGKSAGLRLDGHSLELLVGLTTGFRDRSAETAWSTIPILNEWKQRYPNEDPVRVHQRLFGIRLTTPTKKPLTWNAAFATMESPDFGRPGAAQNPNTQSRFSALFQRAEFGLEFEAEGLRAIVEVGKIR